MNSSMRARAWDFGEDFEARPSGLLVPAELVPAPRPVAVGLFAGAGGFDLGFHMAGWHVAAAVEYDLDAACTYLANLGGPDTVIHVDPDVIPKSKRTRWIRDGLAEHGHIDQHGRAVARCADVYPLAGTGWISHRGQPDDPQPNEFLTNLNRHPPADEPAVEHLWIVDVRQLTGAEILDALGRDRGDIDCVLGGPPCQGYSMAGKRDVMDPRNSLVFDFGRLVVELYPKTMVMENVPQVATMRTPAGLLVLDQLALMLAEGGMGTVDALKRTLAATAGTGVGAATRVTSTRQRAGTGDDHVAGEDAVHDELGGAVQEELFA